MIPFFYKYFIICLIMLLIFLPNISIVSNDVLIYNKTFINKRTSNALSWIRNSNISNDNLVFILFSEDLSPAYVELWNNYIGAYIGAHLTYIGKIQNFILFKPTIFNNQKTTLLSENSINLIKYYYNLNNKIIVIDDYYEDTSMSKKYLLNEITSGIYTISRNVIDITVPFSYKFNATDYTSKSDLWYTRKYEKFGNVNFMEIYGNISSEQSINYEIPVFHNGTYLIKITLYDLANYYTPIKVFINDDHIGTIEYNNSKLMSNINYKLNLRKSNYNLTISPSYPGFTFIILKEIEITRHTAK